MLIYVKIGSDWHILFLSDDDTQKGPYKDLNEEQCSWLCVIADEEFSKMLKQKLKSERELLNILNELKKNCDKERVVQLLFQWVLIMLSGLLWTLTSQHLLLQFS